MITATERKCVKAELGGAGVGGGERRGRTCCIVELALVERIALRGGRVELRCVAPLSSDIVFRGTSC